jgi:hypothetical protein
VPVSSVNADNQVKVVRSGRVETVTVVTGISSADLIEVISGLNEGEQVVL